MRFRSTSPSRLIERARATFRSPAANPNRSRATHLRHRPLAALIVAGCFALSPQTSSAQAICSTIGLPAGTQLAEIETSLGPLCIELLDGAGQAPLTVDNFLYYVNSGELQDTFFHRVVPGFIVQGGSFIVGSPTYEQRSPRPPGTGVTNEPCTKDIDYDPTNPSLGQICSVRGNERGSVALAKVSGDPNSGTTDWFINTVDNRRNLDNANGGFTVFGQLRGEASFATLDAMESAQLASYTDHIWMRAGFQFSEQPLPIVAPPLYDSDEYGCFDPNLLATVLLDADLPQLTLDPADPLDPTTFYYTVSRTCGTPILQPDFVPNPGPGSCPSNDRLALVTNLPTPSTGFNPEIPTPFTYVSLTCEQMLESDTERALWEADFKQDFNDKLLYVESAAHVIAAPEPGAALSAFVALGTLAGLHRRKRRWARFSAQGGFGGRRLRR